MPSGQDILEVCIPLRFRACCFEAIHSERVLPLATLLSESSSGDQWLHRLPTGLFADAAITVFSPNVVTRPEGSSLTYVGAFEWRYVRQPYMPPA